jgi:hypothetical protein
MTYAPNTVLVSNLITGARQRADMLATQFVTDAEVLALLDNSYRKFYNEVINKYQNYFVSEQNVTLVPNQEDYDLPSDLLKVLGVDVLSGGKSFTMMPWSLNERNRLITGWVGRPIRYILKGSKIKLTPTPTTTDTVKIYYVPAPAELTSGSSVEVFNGFDEYIMIDTAIMLKQKEEADVQVLLIQKQELKQLIFDTMAGRDAGFPEKVTDIARLNDQAWYQFWGI